MRGDDEQSGHLSSYLSPEHSVPADHPLRTIRTMTDDAVRRLSPRFEAIYATTGRPSIPPEHLLRALLLQVLYSVRSERTLMEQLQYNLLFRWFVGARHGRRRLGVDNLHEESGSAAGGRHRGRVLAVAIRMQQNSFRRKFEDYIRRHPKSVDRRRKGYTAVAAKMARVAYGVVTTGTEYRRFPEAARPGGKIPSPEAVEAHAIS